MCRCVTARHAIPSARAGGGAERKLSSSEQLSVCTPQHQREMDLCCNRRLCECDRKRIVRFSVARISLHSAIAARRSEPERRMPRARFESVNYARQYKALHMPCGGAHSEPRERQRENSLGQVALCTQFAHIYRFADEAVSGCKLNRP